MKVSIIIPTFNRAHLIGDTLDSFLKQSYRNWEILVIDDGSDDGTEEVVSKYKDDRIRLIPRSQHRKKGPCGARNTGLDHAWGACTG